MCAKEIQAFFYSAIYIILSFFLSGLYFFKTGLWKRGDSTEVPLCLDPASRYLYFTLVMGAFVTINAPLWIHFHFLKCVPHVLFLVQDASKDVTLHLVAMPP